MNLAPSRLLRKEREMILALVALSRHGLVQRALRRVNLPISESHVGTRGMGMGAAMLEHQKLHRKHH